MAIKSIDKLITDQENLIWQIQKRLEGAQEDLKALKLEQSCIELKQKYPIGISVETRNSCHTGYCYQHYKICGYEKREDDIILKGYVWSGKKGEYSKKMEHSIHPQTIVDSEWGD